MLSGDGNKNRKKNTSHLQHTFLYISLPFVLPKTSLSYTFYGGNVVCVPSVHLLFSMPLIFILMAASTSHFPAAAIKFSCYSSYVITLPCYLSLFLLQMLKFKLSQKKELALLLLLFLSLKSRWLCDLPPKCLGMSIKFSFPRRADSWLPSPFLSITADVQVGVQWRHNQIFWHQWVSIFS